ncbi:MAG: DUF1294 domain-containing protein [Pseudoflavonifractor sp.]
MDLSNIWAVRGQWLGIALAAMNLLVFCLMGRDKSRAKHGGWRVREASFFILAALGGSLGGILGMFAFHHKTRHWYFKFGLPAILRVQLVAILRFW